MPHPTRTFTVAELTALGVPPDQPEDIQYSDHLLADEHVTTLKYSQKRRCIFRADDGRTYAVEYEAEVDSGDYEHGPGPDNHGWYGDTVEAVAVEQRPVTITRWLPIEADARPLPHDPYITAVTDALTSAGLAPTEWWTDDGETRGMYCYLNAVITLDPSGTHDDMPEEIPTGTAWPHGLLLIWEWHTGVEAELGEPERGPVWQFAELKADGSNEYPTGLPVHGYASPAAIVEAARKVIDHSIKPGHQFNFGAAKWDGGIIGDSWEHANELEAAAEEWGAAEASED